MFIYGYKNIMVLIFLKCEYYGSNFYNTNNFIEYKLIDYHEEYPYTISDEINLILDKNIIITGKKRHSTVNRFD